MNTDIRKQIQDLRFGHIAHKIEDDAESSDSRTKLTLITGRQLGQISSTSRGRVVLGFFESHIIRLYFNVGCDPKILRTAKPWGMERAKKRDFNPK